MAKITRYKHIPTFVLGTYNNSGDNYVVLIGANMVTTEGTIAANAVSQIIVIKDSQGAVCDSISVKGDNYVAVPASGGTIFVLQLTKRMICPPGGSISSPNSIAAGIQIIEAIDTSQFDGKDSLENALAIK